MEPKILVTGDYWHRDFKQFLSGFDAVTLVPMDKILNLSSESIDLVVVAQSRRDQYSIGSIEMIQTQFGTTPVVAVLGSWCEGELRSGNPWPGVHRVYWHQWSGRFETFVEQLRKNGITNWHAPRTSSVADQIQLPRAKVAESRIQYVGISSWTQSNFEFLQDAIGQLGWRSRWVERSTWDASTNQVFDPICIDADSYTPDVDKRLNWLRSEFPTAAFVMVLNFPRPQDITELSGRGILQVVSKPFELNDLKTAIIRAFRTKLDVKTSDSTN